METKQLNVGDTAHDFTVTDVMGNTVRLSDYKKKSVLLLFLRYASCPWCNLTIQRLTLEHPLLKKQDCQIIAFIQSEKQNIIKNIYKRHTTKPQFPIIADPTKKIYNQYGVKTDRMAAAKSILRVPQWLHAVRDHNFKQGEVDGDLFLVPAMFLIARRSQKVVELSYGNSFYDFESLFPVYESLIFNEA